MFEILAGMEDGTANPKISGVKPIFDLGGYQIGSVFDTRKFLDYTSKVPNWNLPDGLSPEQISVARRVETGAHKIHKNAGPRKFSGLPGYSHVLEVIFTEMEAAQAVSVPLSFENLIEALVHDDQELDTRIKTLRKKWEQAAEKSDDSARKSLEERLANERANIKAEHMSRMADYIAGFNFIGKIKGPIKRDLEMASINSYHLTRFTEGYMYAKSMRHVFTRRGSESIVALLSRAFTKLADRTANNREYSPYPGLRSYVSLWNGRQELTDRFGAINPKVKEMPAALMIGTAFKSVYPLKFLNETLNKYEAEIGTGKYGNRAIEMLKLVKYARGLLIESAVNLLNRAITIYEKKLTSDEIAEVDREVEEKKRGSFYNRVTTPGVLSDWTYFIDGGDRYMASLEVRGNILENYRAARHFKELLPRFGMFHERGADYQRPLELKSDDDSFNPSRHEYFKLKGVSQLFDLSADYWQHIGDLIRSSKKQPKGFLSHMASKFGLL